MIKPAPVSIIVASALLSCLGIGLAASLPAQAQLSFGGSLSAEESLVLQDDDSYSSVASVSPSATLGWQQRRSSLNAFYSLQASNSIRYRDLPGPADNFTKNNRASHRLAFSGQSQLIAEKLSVNASANISRILRDPSRGPSLNASQAGNIAAVKSIQGGGNLNQSLWPRANLALSGQVSQSDLDNKASRGADLSMDFNTSSRTGRLWANLGANRSFRTGAGSSTDGALDNYLTSASGQVGSYIVPTVQGFFRAQSEQAVQNGESLLSAAWRREIGLIWQPGVRSQLSVSYYPDSVSTPWGASAQWQASRRTSFNASYQDRYFGDAWQAQVSHATRLLRNSLSYSDSITSADRELLAPVVTGTLLCPAGTDDISLCDLVPVTPGNQPVEAPPGQEALTVLALQPILIEGLYRQQALSLSTAYQRSKTTLSANAGATRRFSELDNTDDGTQSLSMSVAWGVQATVALNYDWSLSWRQDQALESNNDKSTVWQASSGARFAMSPRLSMGMTASTLRREQATDIARETRLSCALNYTF